MTTWILLLMLEARPPGDTYFSVVPVPQCDGAERCEGAKRSSFYGESWVRQETYEQGKARYVTLAVGQERAIEQVLCVRLDGTKIPDCRPESVALDRKSKRLLFGPWTAAAGLTGLSIPESGLREDVQVGRGFAKKCPKGGPKSIPGVCGPSDDGGQGRGPGGEACVTQIHPSIGWRFADGDPDVRRRAEAGDPAAREAVMQSLVGLDAASIERCWRTSLRMLLHSKAHCDWALAKGKVREDWDFAMFSLYGTGTSCVSGNNGKTRLRVELFRKFRERIKVMAKAS